MCPPHKYHPEPVGRSNDPVLFSSSKVTCTDSCRLPQVPHSESSPDQLRSVSRPSSVAPGTYHLNSPAVLFPWPWGTLGIGLVLFNPCLFQGYFPGSQFFQIRALLSSYPQHLELRLNLSSELGPGNMLPKAPLLIACLVSQGACPTFPSLWLPGASDMPWTLWTSQGPNHTAFAAPTTGSHGSEYCVQRPSLLVCISCNSVGLQAPILSQCGYITPSRALSQWFSKLLDNLTSSSPLGPDTQLTDSHQPAAWLCPPPATYTTPAPITADGPYQNWMNPAGTWKCSCMFQGKNRKIWWPATLF